MRLFGLLLVTVVITAGASAQPFAVRRVPLKPGVGLLPLAVAYSADGRWLVTANTASYTASIIDRAAGVVRGSVATGVGPGSVAISPQRPLAVVTNSGTIFDASADTVTIVDLPRGEVRAVVEVGDAPTSVVIGPGGDKAVIINSNLARLLRGEAEGGSLSVIDLERGEVERTLSLDFFPGAVGAVCQMPDRRLAYLVDQGSGTVHLLDMLEYGVRSSFSIAAFVEAVSACAVAPSGALLLLADQASQAAPALVVVDLATHQPVARIAIPGQPDKVVFTQDDTHAVVSLPEDGALAFVDLQAGNVVETLPVGDEPRGLAVSPDGAELAVALRGSQGVRLVDLLERAPATFFGPTASPAAVRVVPDGEHALVTSTELVFAIAAALTTRRVGDLPVPKGRLDVIDLRAAQVASELPLLHEPGNLAFLPSGAGALITNLVSDQLTLIDLTELREAGAIPTGDGPGDVAVLPRANQAVVTNFFGRSLDLFDLSTSAVVRSTSLGGQPITVAVTPDEQRALVVVAGGDPLDVLTPRRGSLALVDLTTGLVLHELPLGMNPLAAALLPDGESALVANSGAVFDRAPDSLSLVDLLLPQVRDTVEIADFPTALAVSPTSRRAFVTHGYANMVSVLDLASFEVLERVDVGAMPISISVTPDGARAVVANLNTQDLHVLTEIAALSLGPGALRLQAGQKDSSAIMTAVDRRGEVIPEVDVVLTSTNPNVVQVPRGVVSGRSGRTSFPIYALAPGTANIMASVGSLTSNLMAVKVAASELAPSPEAAPAEEGGPRLFRVYLTLAPAADLSALTARAFLTTAENAPVPRQPVEFEFSLVVENQQAAQLRRLSTLTVEGGGAETSLNLAADDLQSVTIRAIAGSLRSNSYVVHLRPADVEIDEVRLEEVPSRLTEGDAALGGKPQDITVAISPPRPKVPVNVYSSDPRVIEVRTSADLTDAEGRLRVTLLPRSPGAAEILAQAGRRLSPPVGVTVESLQTSAVSLQRKETGADGSNSQAAGQPAKPQEDQEATAPSTIRLLAAVSPPREGVEVRFSNDDPTAAAVDVRAFTDAEGIARATVTGLAEGEANITATVLRGPTSNAVVVPSTDIPPAILTGQVVDATTQQGAPGALIELLLGEEPLAQTVGAENGFYLMSFPAGAYHVNVSAETYISHVEQVTLAPGSTSTLHVPLGRAAPSLAFPSLRLRPALITDTTPAELLIDLSWPAASLAVSDVGAYFDDVDITAAFLDLIANGTFDLREQHLTVSIPLAPDLLAGLRGEFRLHATINAVTLDDSIFINVPSR